MSVLQRDGARVAGEGSRDRDLEGAYAAICQECLLAGLVRLDAEDVAQDVFLWILRNRPFLNLPAMPWLEAVTWNFIHRFRRGRARRIIREQRASEVSASTYDDRETLERTLSLNQLEQRLPSIEGELLRLIRRGSTFNDAARGLKIPRGSWSFFRKGLLTHAAERLEAPVALQRPGSKERSATSFRTGSGAL
jgi:DNA-directed RNA polymerase specialized sigma24 family protein